MTKTYTYPCVFYYESDRKRKNEYRIHICFPDFIQAGIPASIVSHNKDKVHMAAQELLEDTLEILTEEKEQLPQATLSLEDIMIDRRVYFDKLGSPFRIEIEHISAVWAKKQKREVVEKVEVEVEEVIEAGKQLSSILSGRIQNNKCIISSIGGVPIREGAYSSDKLRSLYRAINSEGESIALNFSGKRIELNREQSLMLRDELVMIADELDKSDD
ncbi:hypothetical protein [Bacillus taeanensis]|uniref:Uncharacterized protein n=1 Tax=Bacillus taeanensis TaxID=273032 RepID=A0A366XT98_9BACI|nr:hypothetical protein [Bacillus taeanensis]RBW67969.1 hypothetical protein DS031_19380 [Bacillus taeanensis]